MKKTTLFSLAAALLIPLVQADQVRIDDGTVLNGTILEITPDTIRIQTTYAGDLTIDRAQVASFSTEAERHIRLESGTVFVGRATEAPEEGALVIEGTDGTLTTRLAQVVEGWGPDQKDPKVVAAEKAAAALERNWSVRSTARVGGREGNTKESSIEAGISAELEGKKDQLRLTGAIERKTRDDQRTADRKRGEIRYTYYVLDALGWYVRTALEQDRFQNIRFRSTTAGGLSYRIAWHDHYRLSVSGGLSYRYEDYIDGQPSEGDIGLDFGLNHLYRYNKVWELRNELTYTPSVEEVDNYLLIQDSHLTFPLAASDMWKIRFGLRNEFNSQPARNRKHLDTIYYSSLVVDWL